MCRRAVLLLALLAFVTSAEAQFDNCVPGGVPAWECVKATADGSCRLYEGVRFMVRGLPEHATPCTFVGWDFGDGMPGTRGNPQIHRYAKAGHYTAYAWISTYVGPRTLVYQERYDIVIADRNVFIDPVQITEGQSGELRMTRDNTSGSLVVPWTLVQNSAATVTPTSGTITFASGESSAVTQLQASDVDDTYRPDRRFDIHVGILTDDFEGPGPSFPGTHVLYDDDYPVVDFAQHAVTVQENAGSVVLPIVRASGDASTPFDVAYSYVAPDGQRYGLFSFAPGQMARSLVVPIVDNNRFGANPEIHAFLYQPSSSTRAHFPPGVTYPTARITVTDDDPPPHVTATSIAVTEGDTGVRNVSVQLTSVTPAIGDVAYTIVSRNAQNGVDYIANAHGTVDLAATNKIDLTIVGDRDVELDEVLTIALSRASGNFTTGPPVTVTILNDDAGLGPDHLQVPVGGTVSVMLNVGTIVDAPLVVPLATTRPDLVQIPRSITVPAGQNRARFAVTGLATDGSTVRISATLPSERDGTQTIRADVYQPLQLDFDPPVANVMEGQDLTVRISLSPDDTERELAVHVFDPLIASAPESVTVTHGSGTFVLHGLTSGTTMLSIVNPDASASERLLEVNVFAPEGELPSGATIAPANGPTAGGRSLDASGTHLTSESHAVLRRRAGAGVVEVALACGINRFTLTNGFTYVAVPLIR